MIGIFIKMAGSFVIFMAGCILIRFLIKKNQEDGGILMGKYIQVDPDLKLAYEHIFNDAYIRNNIKIIYYDAENRCVLYCKGNTAQMSEKIKYNDFEFILKPYTKKDLLGGYPRLLWVNPNIK